VLLDSIVLNLGYVMKRNRNNRKMAYSLMAAPLLLSFAISSCSDKKKGDKKKDTTVNTGTIEVSSSLGAAYPESLAISVFPETVDAEAQSAGTIAVPLLEEDGAQSIRQKVKQQKKFLSGNVDSCIPSSLKLRTPRKPESCYEFDQDMLVGSRNGKSLGTHDGKSSGGEACLVAFARAEIDSV
jgi:hypothetical protein